MSGFLKQALALLHDIPARIASVSDIRRLSDHLLDDIGLRRDQLDALSEGVPPGPAEPFKTTADPVTRMRQPLQGCG